MDGLLCHAQLRCNLLPRPAKGASTIDVEFLKMLQQPAQGSYGPQPLVWILAPGVTYYFSCDHHWASAYADTVAAVNRC